MGAPTPPPVDHGASALRRRRDELAEQVAELHWDLGGLTYEMAIRDHFRLDLLVRHAATLQERDAELAEVERLLRLEENASAGSCPTCAAPHSRGALFCWQCGATLMERAPSTVVPVDRDTVERGAAGREDSGEDTFKRDAAVAPKPAAREAFGRDRGERDTLVIGPAAATEE